MKCIAAILSKQNNPDQYVCFMIMCQAICMFLSADLPKGLSSILKQRWCQQRLKPLQGINIALFNNAANE